MALSRGDSVPADCGPSGLIGNLITQPIVDPGDQTLDTDTGKTGKLILGSGAVPPISDFQICDGFDVADPYENPFAAFQTGRILRGYVASSGSTCSAPITFDPALGLESDGFLFSGTGPLIYLVTFGPKTYGFFATSDIWTQPFFAGEQWRITSQDYPFTSDAGIWLSGTIDGSGFPTGLALNHLGPGVFLLEFQGLGITSLVPNPDFPTGGPVGPLNIQYRYKLFYSCKGNWLHVAGITPW